MWSWSRLPDGISRASAHQFHISGNFTLIDDQDLRRQVYLHAPLQAPFPVCPPQVIHQIVRVMTYAPASAIIIRL